MPTCTIWTGVSRPSLCPSKSFAEGLSGKLQSGDIVSVIAPDYKQQGQTVVPAELQYVEVISVTASSGYDANTGEPAADEEDDKELPDTVTLLVSPEQAKVLAELEAEGTTICPWSTGVTGKTPANSWPHKMISFWNCIPRSQTPRRSPRRTPLRQTPPLIPAKPQKRRRPQAPRRWPDAELQESRHFLPRTVQEDACEQEEQCGGVLAVWGSPAAARPLWPCGWPSTWPISAGM